MTTIINTVKELRETLKTERITKSIAFVPTMGNLHAGHISLVKKAKQHADIVVVSIFVNPTQFGEGEDFDSYPRTLDADVAKLEDVATDYVFAPNVTQLYPNFPKVTNTHIGLGELTTYLCGHSRPTHFDGVGLIVSKLFNIVQPDSAIFGKKDYQQLALIRQLVDELDFPIDIIGSDIVRADDGLALSSRNQYLTTEQRAIAPQLNALINELGQQLSEGEHINSNVDEPEHYPTKLTSLINQTIKKINATGYKIDYLNVLTPKLTQPKASHKELVILVAAALGQARLLDNIEVTVL